MQRVNCFLSICISVLAARTYVYSSVRISYTVLGDPKELKEKKSLNFPSSQSLYLNRYRASIPPPPNDCIHINGGVAACCASAVTQTCNLRCRYYYTTSTSESGGKRNELKYTATTTNQSRGPRQAHENGGHKCGASRN